MKRILLLWLLSCGAVWALAQPCGLNDTLLINPNSNPTFDYEVFNIFNDDLSNADQGICGIEIYFLHQFVDNLVIAVTSPGGQTVTLTGPNTNEQFSFTPAARWRITFVSCADIAQPDFGYLPAWDNNQPNNFVAGGQYTGSYYPYQGCLEDFNTGTVNGTWSIEVMNDPSPYPGAILGFRLLFCDDRGLDCCFAASGDLDSDDDVLTCVGDSSLVFEIDPIFNGTPPDSNEYGYTYLIAEDAVLLEYDSMPDLSSYPPGMYQICGLSYQREDLDSFPNPDGFITIDSIRTNLDGLEPIFCGELTDTCIWVEILPLPDTSFLTETICEGDSLMVGDTVLYNDGMHFIPLQSYASCDSTVVVDLTVVPTATTLLQLAICEGDSVQVGDSIYYDTGVYIDTLEGAFMCDSIVTLELDVLQAVFTDLDEVICSGDELMVGDSLLEMSGYYEIYTQSAAGCDSIVRVNLEVLEPEAIILPPDTLDCAQTMIALDGATSTPGGQINFTWLDAEAMPLGSFNSLNIDSAGLYILEVNQVSGGVTCTHRDSVFVIADTIPPIADAGLTDTINCYDASLMIGGTNTSVGAVYSYEWQTIDGTIIGSINNAFAEVNAEGTYTLIVANTDNSCTDTAAVFIEEDMMVPIASAGPDTTLNCDRTSLELDGSASSMGAAFTYDWISDNGVVPVDANTLTPQVVVDGIYRLLVSNEINGCADSAFVTVTYDTLRPEITILEPDTLNCTQTTLTLLANISNAGTMPNFNWTASNGGNIFQDENTLMPIVNTPGTYTLSVTNTLNGCDQMATVTVVENVNQVIADAGTADTLNCFNDTITLNASGSTQGSNISYIWSTTDGQFVGANTGQQVQLSAGGTYQLIVQDIVTLCADTSDIIVVQDTLAPIADAGPMRTLSCDSTFVTLDGTNSSMSGDLDYLWLYVPDSTPVGINTLAPTVNLPGAYMLLVSSLENGCLDTSFVDVAIDTISPLIVIESPGMLNCGVQELDLNASVMNAGASYSIDWQASNGGVILNNENTLAPSIGAAGMYTLTITNDSTGCNSFAVVVVQDTITQPQVSIAPVSSLNCLLDQIPLDTINASITPDVVFSWSTNEGIILGDTSTASVTAALAGTYYLTVEDTLTQCIGIDSVEVLIDTIPPFAEAGTGFELNCSVLEGTLSGSGSETGIMITYEWTGPCIVSVDNTQIDIDVDCPGTYYLTVNNTSNGCSAVDSVIVLQDDNVPVADVGGNNYVLTCDSLTLTLDGGNSSQGVNYTYAWTGPQILSGSNTLYPEIGLPGQYTLMVTDTVNTCISTATANVTQDTISPVSDAGEFDVLTCDSLMVEIGGIETSVNGPYAYEWTTENGNIVSMPDQVYITVNSAGIYQLIVVNTENGCRDTSFTEVFDNTQPPEVNAGPDQTLDCATPSVILGVDDAMMSANLFYQWSGPCIISATDSSQVEVNCDGIYVLSVYDNASTCTSLDTVIVSRDDSLPIASLPDSLMLSCDDGTLIIDASASVGSIFSWYLDGNLTTLSGLMPVVDSIGVYTLIAENMEQDCSDTASVIVSIDCLPVISIATPDTLTCAVQSVLLDASNSTTGPSITYEWIAPDANCLSNGQGTSIAEVRCGGIYELVVANSAVGVSDTAQITVYIDTIPPFAEAGPFDTLTCDEPIAILDGSASTQGAHIGYLWAQLEDEFFMNDSLQATVNNDGTYFLTVIDSLTGCTDEDVVIIQRSADLPDINFSSTVIPCLQESFWLEAFVEPLGPDYEYSWEGDVILGMTDSAAVLLDTAGLIRLTVVNPANNCTVYRDINVIQQQCIPCLEALPADSLTCAVDTVMLSAYFCEPCEGCTVQWSSSSSGTFLSATDSLGVLVGSPGIYTITAFDTLGFSESLQIDVIENLTPPPVNAGIDQALECDNPSVGLGTDSPIDSLYTYQWTSESGIPLEGDTLPQITVSFPDTFYLEVTNIITGCTATDEVVVTINTQPPVAEAGDTAMITCESPIISLDGSGSTFGNNITYFWEGPEDGIITGINAFNPVIGEGGWYTLTVTDTLTGCFAIDSVLVNVDAAIPTVPEIPDTSLNCASNVVLLTGTLPVGDEFSFCWYLLDDMGNPISACVDMLTIPVSIPGTYRFEVTNNNNNCSNSVNVVIGEDYDLPIADAGMDAQMPCTLDSLQLIGSAAPDTAIFEYSWTAQGGSLLSENNVSNPYIYTPDTYILTVINLLNQCEASDTVVISLDDEAPIASAGMDTFLTCIQTSVRLQGDVQTDSGQSIISWSTPDGNIILDEQTLMPLLDQAGTYIISVIDPANGCTTLDTALVTDFIDPPIAAIIDTSQQLNCKQDSIVLDASSSMASTSATLSYDWRRLPLGTIGVDDTIVVGNTGTYSLIVTDDLNGCKDTLTFNVSSDYTIPGVAINNPESITCIRESVTLDATGSSVGDEFEYIWIAPAGDTLSQNELVLEVSEAGEYIFLVTNSENGCLDSVTQKIMVDTVAPIASILSPDPLDCIITTSVLDGKNSSVGEDYEYHWTTVSPDGVLLSGQDSLVAVAGFVGMYALEVTDISNGCTTSDTTEVIALAAPIEDVLSEIIPPSCTGRLDGEVLIDSIVGGTPPYLVSFGDGPFMSATVFSDLAPGVYSLSIEDSNGCTWQDSLIVPETSTFEVNLEMDATILLGQTDTLIAIPSTTEIDSVWWWPTDGIQIPSDPLSYIVAPSITTVYSVWVSTVNDCIATNHVTIKVRKDAPIYAPNIFSPNGDENNDVFLLFAGSSVVTIHEFRVFDRWGNMVHEATDFAPNDEQYGWDGNFEGYPMDPAVFAFYAKIELTDGRVEIVEGEVLLMR